MFVGAESQAEGAAVANSEASAHLQAPVGQIGRPVRFAMATAGGVAQLRVVGISGFASSGRGWAVSVRCGSTEEASLSQVANACEVPFLTMSHEHCAGSWGNGVT